MEHSEVELTATTADGVKIAVRVVAPHAARGVALLMHGYSSGKNNKTNRSIVPVLWGEGIVSIRFDFRGHYDSGGEIERVCLSSGIADAQAAVSVVRSVLPHLADKPLSLFGTSYGGAIAIALTTREPHIAGVTLKSGASDLVAMQRHLRGAVGMMLWRLRGWAPSQGDDPSKRIPYSYVRDARRYDLCREAVASGLPFFLMHGTADETVPVEQSRRLATAIGSKAKLVEIDGGDHHYSNPGHWERMVRDCSAAITAQAIR